MVRKLPLTDFRAVRSKLEPHEFAISDGQDAPPSNPVEQEVWDGIVHLPEDVSICISDHNGTRLELLFSLWSDWIEAIGDPDKPDEIFNCMLDAADAFQGAHFNFLHGYYRVALSELRVALELVLIGACGTLQPNDAKYLDWKKGFGELGFTRCRKNLSGIPAEGTSQVDVRGRRALGDDLRRSATIRTRDPMLAMLLSGKATVRSITTKPSS